ncbi:MAG: acyl-homoserine-lactone synthase [Sphingomonadales bacterium]
MFEVHAVRSPTDTAYARQFDQMFRQRYDVFVRILKWEIPGVDHRRCREQDQFDGEDTVYLLVIREGDVLGASRLVPTTGPNLMRDVFPGLCKDGPPESPAIWEWSRGHVKPDEPHEVRSKVLDHIFASGYEYALKTGIGALTAQINASEFPRWLKRGLVVDVLGPPLPLADGSEVVALKHMITPATLARVRAETGLPGPVIVTPAVSPSGQPEASPWRMRGDRYDIRATSAPNRRFRRA